MATVGFIGIGNMGGPMAVNLGKAGHQVTVFDASPEAMRRMQAENVAKAGSLGDAVANVDVVMTMVPAGPQVRDVYLGEGGVLARADKRSLLIDCSTIDVDSARAVAEDAKQRGYRMIDAPVSGGVMGAQAGTLTLMCGGDAADVEAARPYLEKVGRRVVHCGPSGNGQAAKICNNMLAAICMVGTSEAFIMGERLGLDPKVLFDVISTSSGSSFALTNYSPWPDILPNVPSSNGYKPGFAAAMMWKDLRLAMAAARATGSSTPLGAATEALYAMFNNKGHGNVDTTGILRMLKGEV